ncbi:hypothetical protein QA596_00635 [Balneolales bacterium ANBcel1]|nr:hypothetical protein [Balneolales bacterium ANBcel1]
MMKSDADTRSRLQTREMPQPEIYPVAHPVLLCHGYGTIAGFITPSPLHKVCMHMRKHGIRAYAPNVVPYGKIEVRAAGWLKTLGVILKQTGARKVHIVAYSMGGLDARYMIHRHNLGDVVASLTTIAAPHKGSSLADIALDTPDTVRKQLLKINDLVGNKIYPSIASDTKGALEQLTRRHVVDTFNRQIRDVPGIPYYSFSAACGKGTGEKINPTLMLFNRLIHEHEGINDGFVSRESAVYGDHIRTTSLSHLEQIKVGLMREHKKEWFLFWEDVMQLLLETG